MLETTTLLLIAVGITNGADIPANLTEEDLAKDNKLFLTVASKGLKWEEPTEPIKIV